MTTNNLAIAGNFFLFIEVLEKFQVVCGTFWIELFFGMSLETWNILDSWNIRVGSGGCHL